jgi:hypothetical protein
MFLMLIRNSETSTSDADFAPLAVLALVVAIALISRFDFGTLARFGSVLESSEEQENRSANPKIPDIVFKVFIVFLFYSSLIEQH